MTQAQDRLGKLDEAMEDIRSSVQALGQVPNEAVPRVTIDGAQHQLLELEQRLRALHEDLEGTESQGNSDHE
jgi:hypothetical protein